MTQLGKYTLVRKLAVGGMAEVFLATAAGPMGFKKTLVLKRILPHLAEDPQFVGMFLAEAKLAAQLNHPNIVQIFDFGEAQGAYFLAMEHIDGPNLRMLARRAKAEGVALPPAACAKAISFACEGLAYAHDFADPETGEPLNLIHRDISPDNVLLSRQGAVKVVDFGIAKAAGQTQHTKTGTLKGKLAYMPPEQLHGQPLDRRADVFALGMVLYELLTGVKPFDATSEVSMMRAILYEPMIPANTRRADLPEELVGIIHRALAKVREERYPDCRALQGDLERFIHSTGETVGAFQLAGLVAKLTPPALIQENLSSTPTGPKGASIPPGSPPRPSAPPPPPPGTGVVSMTDIPEASAIEISAVEPSGVPVALLAPLPPGSEPGPNGKTSATVPHRPGAMGSNGAVNADLLGLGALSVEPVPVPLTAPKRSMGALAFAAGSGALVALGLGALFWFRTQHAESAKPPAAPVAEAPKPPPAPPPEPVQVADKAPAPPAEVEAPKALPKAEPAPTVHGTGKAHRPATGKGAHTRTLVAREDPPANEAPPAKAAPSPVAEAAGSTGASFQIETTPPAQVRVNGKFACASPCAVKNQKPGEVRVEVYDSRLGFSKEETFLISAGENGTKRVVVGQGTVEFRIRPYASVILDGRPLGQTPFAPIQVYEGKHSLRLVNHELNKDVASDYVVKPGQLNIFKFNLEE